MGNQTQQGGGAHQMSLGGPREPKTTIKVSVQPDGGSGSGTVTITITVEPASLGGDRQTK